MLVHSRKSLIALKEEFPQCGDLALDPRFDMGRVVAAEDPELAIKFAYLEHVVRTTTPGDEARNVLRSLPKELGDCLKALIQGKDTLFQETFAALEQNVCPSDLADMLVPDVALHLIFVSGTKTTERDLISPGYTRLPHIYIGVLEAYSLILYSPYMTYVDGYNANTGVRSNHSIPPDMIEPLLKELYWEGEAVDDSLTLEGEADRSLTNKQPEESGAQEAASSPLARPLHPRMKSLVVEWRSYDHRNYRKHLPRETCAGLGCCVQ